ncbi:uncharacterized protein [Argopecten irradians]|uniref:uncharacterized protein n=1 Tax=Argopecten irradians TaxID=31199 RepID=UPI0037135857
MASCEHNTRRPGEPSMDDKHSKCHDRPGNTLRTSKKRYSHRYRQQTYRIHLSTYEGVSPILEEFGLDMDHVAYSLNKKERWLVPQILEKEVSEDEIGDSVECSKVFCSKNGSTTKSPMRTFMYLKTPCENSDTFTIDVEISRQIASFLDCSSKYPCNSSKSSRKSGPSNFSHRRQSHSNQCAKNRHRKTRSKCLESDYYCDFAEDEDDYLETIEDTYNQPKGVSFGDILINSSKMQALVKIDQALRKPCYNDGLTASNIKPSLHNMEEQTSYTTVLIPNMEVMAEHLKEAFGEDYTECRCLPRKFLIDITDRVTRRISKSKDYQNKDNRRIDLSAILVFTYDMIGSLDLTDIDSFKVSINMKSTQRCLKMDTLPENSIMGVKGIVHCALTYIDSLPYDSFMCRNLPKINKKYSENYRNILKLCTTKSAVRCPEFYTIKDILKGAISKQPNAVLNDDFEFVPPDMCSICFESLTEVSATALQSCGHYFCDRCWNDHVTSTHSGMSGQITCPQYKCRCPVDYDILLTISNLQIVEGLFRRRISMDIEKDPNSQWCPNKTCGRVVTYDRAGLSTNVSCECGTDFCFECLQPIHWPLSCQDYEMYIETLSEHGHIDKLLHLVDKIPYNFKGKRCPVCKTFMEKEGKCMQMRCICGTIFCWACLKVSERHRRRPCPWWRRWRFGDMYKLKRKGIITTRLAPDYYKPAWYKRAVEVRTLHNLYNVKRMSSAVRFMCRTLQRSYINQPDKDICPELEDFEVPESRCYVSTMEKIHPFLTSMVSQYLELSPVCEYTFVFLEKCYDNCLSQLLDRLYHLIKEIHSIFISSHNLDLKSCISRLFYLRAESEKVFDRLRSVVESVSMGIGRLSS